MDFLIYNGLKVDVYSSALAEAVFSNSPVTLPRHMIS